MVKDTLKVLKKEDLLKMLKEQEIEIARLKAEVESLAKQLEESDAAGRQLARAEVESIKNDSDGVIGSIADSAIRLSGVFEAAQTAADKYLEDIRGICARMDAAKGDIEEQARVQADEMLSRAKSECEQYESRKQEIIEETWTNIKAKLDNYYEAHKDLQEILGGRIELPKSDIQGKYENE